MLKSSSGGWFSSRIKQELAKKNEELNVIKDELQNKIRENGNFSLSVENKTEQILHCFK
jgi:hypothetical protein